MGEIIAIFVAEVLAPLTNELFKGLFWIAMAPIRGVRSLFRTVSKKPAKQRESDLAMLLDTELPKEMRENK